MRVFYFLRCPGSGHSLEEITNTLCRAMPKHVHTAVVQMPLISRNLRAVGQNLRFAANWYAVQAPGSIAHITGDVHYVALALPASKTILTIHDCVTLNRHKIPSVKHLFFWLFWYYLPIRRAAVVTAVSEKTRQELRRYVGKVADKIRVVPNSYNPLFVYNPQPVNTLKPTLLHIGTAPNKNLSNVIQAIVGLPCQLLIIGPLSAKDSTALNRLQIDFKNYIDSSREQIVSLYNRCDIVLFVSLYEGFGMPILEAQAVGRPVVTSQLAPMTDVAGADGACFVDPANSASIRKGVLRVWHDTQYRHQLIEAGRQNAEKYNAERMTAQYMTLYEKLD